LTVHLDQSGPSLKVIDDSIDYFKEALPVVRVHVEDDNPDESAGSLSLRSIEGGKETEVERKSYEVKRTGEDWEIRFTARDASLSEGSHDFRIVARDRAGSLSEKLSGLFAVNADHEKPRLEILAPSVAPVRVVRRGENIHVQARVEDAFPDDLSVKVTVSVKAIDFDRQKEVPLSRSTSPGTWEVPIVVGKDFEKPGLFETARPEFQLTVSAIDRAGQVDRSTVTLEFGWENRDKLQWPDGSVLVYHAACSIHNVGPFFMATTEVTNGQYRKFLESGGGNPPPSPDWSGSECRKDRLEFPIRGVSWEEACAYARWAKLELPSRSQWKVAAYWDYDRPNDRPYPWGKNWPAANPPVRYGERSPVEAGAKDKRYAAGRTPFGLCHMLGNVWELVREDETGRAMRVGGAFNTRLSAFESETLKETYLKGGEPVTSEDHDDNVGFRCCLPLKGEIP
jgi:hypothetical protein